MVCTIARFKLSQSTILNKRKHTPNYRWFIYSFSVSKGFSGKTGRRLGSPVSFNWSNNTQMPNLLRENTSKIVPFPILCSYRALQIGNKRKMWFFLVIWSKDKNQNHAYHWNRRPISWPSWRTHRSERPSSKWPRHLRRRRCRWTSSHHRFCRLLSAANIITGSRLAAKLINRTNQSQIMKPILRALTSPIC